MRNFENSYRLTLICIDSYENKIPRGRLYNPSFENGIEFYGVIDLIQNIEKILDEFNFPQDFSLKRSFRASTVKNQVFVADSVKEGNLASFTVKVMFRQNASWQGSVTWHEGKSEENFRSFLELIMLIDSALS